MALIKTPDGGFYLNDTEFDVDYDKNTISLVNPGGGGGVAGVSSFNGRTGAVTPQVGDYTAEQVGAVSLSGGTMTGNLILNGDPTNNLQAATKQYVDVLGDTVNDILDGTEALPYLHDDYTPPIATSSAAGIVKPGTGLEVSGDGTLSVTTSPTSGITQEQADLRYLQLSGGTLTGNLALGNNKITTNSTPSEVSDVTNKGYVDGVVKVVSDEVDRIIAGTTPISVPVATDAKVGGVKIGAGLSVDGEGTLTTAQTYLSTQGGTLEANASITGEDEMTFEVPDSTESATVGITAQGVTIVHNTDSAANARIRVIENNVEIEADGAVVSFDPTGVDFGGGVLTNISSIGGNSGEIAVENTIDLNNHQIKNVSNPTDEQDVVTKNYADATYATKAEISSFITSDSLPVAATTETAGIVKQANPVADSSGATDTTLETKVNELLQALRTAGIIAPNA